MKNKHVSRRKFLKGAGAAAIALPNIITSDALGRNGRPAASERVTLAGIGMGGRGMGDLGALMRNPSVQVLAACDVKSDALRNCKNRVDKHHGNNDCQATTDYREVIARDDIDMILCATPDHWHAQVTIDAMKTGKDVYCEKPLSLTIGEGRKMVNAAREYGRVFSCGSQRVIGDFGRLACAANSGRYGTIHTAHASPGGSPRPCYLPGQPVPDSIDWEMWLGPAPWAPYHPYRCGRAYGLGGKGFRTWYDYSGGMMTDWGGHKFGGAMHGLKVDHTGPREIYPPGTKDKNRDLEMHFEGGKKLIVGGGQRYIGTEGEVKPLREFKVPPGLRWYNDGKTSIYEDFVHCVRTRKTPFRDVEFAHRVATVCHLGNIAYTLQRPLKWDPDKEDFIGDLEASRMVDRPRRGVWQI